MKSRTEIAKELKWDLTDICDMVGAKDRLNQYATLAPKLATFASKLHDKQSLLEYLKLSDTLDKIIYPAIFYVWNETEVDMANSEFSALQMEIQMKLQECEKYSTFFLPEMNKLPISYLKSLLGDKDFADYDMMIERVIRNRPHKLSKHDIDLLNDMSMFVGSEEDVRDKLCDCDIKFAPAIDSKGKSYELNNANYRELMTNPDRTLRKNAESNMLNGFGQYNNTLSEAYIAHLHNDYFHSKLAKFGSCLEDALAGYKIDKKVYTNLIEQVHKNLDILHSFVELKQKELKLDKIEFYDLRMPAGLKRKKYTIEEMQQLILRVLKPLGKEYISLVESKFKDYSIDYMPNKDKRSGAYSNSIYGYKSVIMMNNDGQFDSVDTLIHEMGHAINSELFNRAQPATKADISIFLAEIASTTNELLLLKYMADNAKDKAEKRAYILQILEMYKTTIFTQTLYSEFEQFAHEQVEARKPITYKDLNGKYLSLCCNYYGKSVKVPNYMQYWWSAVPHFYSSYYVYQYATGMICALYIVAKIAEDANFAKRYLDFLRCGNSKWPTDALKMIGIDLTKQDTFDYAFRYARELIKQVK